MSIFIIMGRHNGRTQMKEAIARMYEEETPMTITTAQMRGAIKTAYDGPAWKTKVKSMPDNQIFAVYKSLEKAGKLYPPKKKRDGVQLTFDDIGNINSLNVLRKKKEPNE